jgi:hypothetical protein
MVHARFQLLESRSQTDWRHHSLAVPLLRLLANMNGPCGETFGSFQEFRSDFHTVYEQICECENQMTDCLSTNFVFQSQINCLILPRTIRLDCNELNLVHIFLSKKLLKPLMCFIATNF